MGTRCRVFSGIGKIRKVVISPFKKCTESHKLKTIWMEFAPISNKVLKITLCMCTPWAGNSQQPNGSVMNISPNSFMA